MGSSYFHIPITSSLENNPVLIEKEARQASRPGLDVFKVKVNCTLVQALRLYTGRTAHRGSTGIALRFHDNGTRRGEGLALFPGRSLPPGKTRYPLYRRLIGPQGWSGQARKISSPTGIRSPDRLARSQSLYRLRYSAHGRYQGWIKIVCPFRVSNPRQSSP